MLKIALAIFAVLPKGLVVFIYDAVKPFSQRLFIGIRYCVIKTLCAKAGHKVIIGPNVTFKNWKSINIGSNVSIHDGSYVEGFGGVIIGDNVSIAHHCSLLSTNHTWGDPNLPIRLNPIEKRPLLIGNNVWLGCGVRLLGGVSIGNDVIVGAGSMVTKGLPGNGIYVGSPAVYQKPVYVNAPDKSLNSSTPVLS